MALRLVSLALLRIACGSSDVMIFDDMDESLTTNSLNMEEQGLEQCHGDAHAGKFHHDGARSNGNASFEFKFEVSQSGCYSLEEYHPGTLDNTKCSELLTTNAQLDINWCVGRQSTISLDQSRDGGLWNFVAVFPFYVGHPGAIKMSKPRGVEGKHLVVDAFRITRVADKCTAPLQRQLWRDSEARKQVARTAAKASASTHAATPKVTSAVDLGRFSPLRWQEGSLQLSVQATPGSNDVDLLAALKARTSILADTLRSHLQAGSVIVKDILQLDARRLGSCRRLEAVGNSVDFLVHFDAEVSASKVVAETALVDELTTALAAVDAKFTVESIELEWKPIEAPASTDADSTSLTLLIVLAEVAAVVVCVGAVAIYLSIQRRKTTPTDATDVNATPNEKELEEQNEKAADEKKEEIDDNASTVTPNSDHTPKEIEVDDIDIESVV